MKSFRDYCDGIIFLSPEVGLHIEAVHPEISSEQISSTLLGPDEVRQSSYRATSILYYSLKSQDRFICVVVKECPEGLFIATAMTTSKPKSGKVLYVRKN